MASLRILVPDGTVNYVKNPSFRYDTAGWTAVGSTLTRTLSEARFNIASMQVTTNGTLMYEGGYYRVNTLQGISEPITASVYVRGQGYVRLRLWETAGGEWNSDKTRLRSDRWTRIYVTGFSNGSNDVRLYVETCEKVQATTFYVDGAQLERHPYETTYVDGDQPDCMWNVENSASLSTRPSDTREGGRWVSLAGCERDDPDIYFTVIGGLGVAPIRNNTQPYAYSPGSYYQNSKVTDRVVTLTFHARAADMTQKYNGSLQKLHQLRQKLFDVIKPDKVKGGQEFIVEYQDGAYPLYFKARYDGGLEGEWDIRNRWINSFPIRLLVVSPYLWEDTQEADALGIRNSATVNYVMQRVDGEWSEMNGGFNTSVLDFAVGSHGEIIAVGNFNKANNKATAIDPEIFANFVCYWDGTQWKPYSTGADGIINAVAVAPNGDVIVTGNFSNIGGVACSKIARWVRATSTWTAMGVGLTGGAGFDVAVAPNGDVYVVGSFTHAGGQLVHYCARYDGAWHSMGTDPGLNDYAYAVAISADGTQVYIGGAFTDEWGNLGSVTAEKIVWYDVSSNLFQDMGDGFDNTVLDLVYTSSNRLYACGRFTESATTGQVLLYVAYWNGSQWFEMEGGADGVVHSLDVTETGLVLAAGEFGVIGSVDASYFAMWNGTSWVNLDVDISSIIYAAIFDHYGNIFCGAGSKSDFAKITNVENKGTAEVSPIIYIVGPARLRWLENQTAGVRIYADMDILEDEEVMFDFAKGSIQSTVRGNLSFDILPGSDMRSWKLLPGWNKIAAMMVDDVGATMYIYHTPRHWSADATQRGDEL